MKAHKNNKVKIVASNDGKLTEIFPLRFTAQDIVRLNAYAKKNGYGSAKRSGAGKFIRELVLANLDQMQAGS